MEFLRMVSGSLQDPQETWGRGTRKQAGNEDSARESVADQTARGSPPAAGHSSQCPLPLGIGPGPWVLPLLPERILNGTCFSASAVPALNGCIGLADFKSNNCSPAVGVAKSKSQA